MALAIVLIILVVGSVLFHMLSPWYLTDIASNWGTIDGTIDITFWVTGFVFVAVNLFLAYVIIRYRHHKHQKADYEPENKKLEYWLTGLTAIGVALMLAPGLVVWGDFVSPPADAAEVEVVGQQWFWSYRFPGDDGEFGKTRAELINEQNPFGMVADDPAGADDVLVFNSQLHLPVDEPLKVLLRSKDVLHNFTVPQFRVKMDLVPGMQTFLWVEPNRPGTYEILCQELCGMAHHTMRGSVVVEERDAFEQWLSGHPTYAATLAEPAGDAVAGKQTYQVCVACHGARAEGLEALNAPKLAGQDPWYLKRQLNYFRAGVRGTHKDDRYGQQMAAIAATLTSDTAVNDVVAYIGTLPDTPSQPTIAGDAERGRDLYQTCQYCHGGDGRGVWSTNAPRQAGINDWYLKTQLENFRAGIRGSHALDSYGPQMILMANVLRDDRAIDDLVAYINTLE